MCLKLLELFPTIGTFETIWKSFKSLPKSYFVYGVGHAKHTANLSVINHVLKIMENMICRTTVIFYYLLDPRQICGDIFALRSYKSLNTLLSKVI